MSNVIESILNFVGVHYPTMLATAFGVGLLVLLQKALTAAFRPRRKSSGEPPLPERVERARYQSIVEDLKSDNLSYRERISQLKNLNTILAPLIKELAATIEQEEIGPRILRVVERLFDPKQALVFLADSHEEILTLTASFGVEGMPDRFQQAIGEGLAGLAAKKKVPLRRSDLRYESNLLRQKALEHEPDAFSTSIAAPIVSRGRVLGVLCMGGRKRLKPEDEALFAMIADMAALALTNLYQYRKIQELANSDPLTGIYNKAYFLEQASRELRTARREDAPMSIVMLDLDHFKAYNDTNGHLAGDKLLKVVAGILRDQVRDEDVVARFGGEEFILMLRRVPGEGAEQVAERIRLAIEHYPFPNAIRQPLGFVSTSVGVASLPEAGSTVGGLVQRADEALYAAKKDGRNRVAVASARLAALEVERRKDPEEMLVEEIEFRPPEKEK